jgi:hypothetical protein
LIIGWYAEGLADGVVEVGVVAVGTVVGAGVGVPEDLLPPAPQAASRVTASSPLVRVVAVRLIRTSRGC